MTPFEAGKSAKDLNIDLTRKFVIVKAEFNPSIVGKKVNFVRYARPMELNVFREENSEHELFLRWDELAYADEPTPEVKEEYLPLIDDKFELIGVVRGVEYLPSEINYKVTFDDSGFEHSLSTKILGLGRLLSRPTLPRKVTMKQIKEHFGENIEIVGE